MVYEKQKNRWGYLNNPEWANPSRPFTRGGQDDYDGRTDEEPQLWTPPNQHRLSHTAVAKHHQCGHWHLKSTTPVINEDIFVIHSYPLTGSPPGATDDRCYRRTKELAEVIWYGGRGSGIDQLACPYGVAVDDTYVWIGDVTNSRVMQRKKSDLTYVQHRDSFRRYSVHTTSGNVVWAGAGGRIDEISKVDLSTVRSISWPSCGVEGYPQLAFDITSDLTYLYVVDQFGHRVVVYDIATLSFQDEVGAPSYWNEGSLGISYYGGYLYVSDAPGNKVLKVDASTYAIVATYGHTNGGSGPGYIQPAELAVDATRVFVADDTNGVVQVLDHNLNYITQLSTGLSYPFYVAVDANYIYVGDMDGFIVRFDASTYAFVDSTVASLTSVYGMCIDSNYIYVVDQDTNLRVVRINISTMAYVDEYTDVGWAIFNNPFSLTVDGTYIYVSDGTYIRRINKSTMAYVDSIALSDTSNAHQTVINGSYIYIADNNGGVQKYNVSTFVYIDGSPATTGSSDYWMDWPNGITCDENYIYVTDGVLDEVKIYRKSDLVFVDKFAVGEDAIHIAVDATYLYLTANFSYASSRTRKFLKTSPYTEVANQAEEYAIGIDTAYIYQL